MELAGLVVLGAAVLLWLLREGSRFDSRHLPSYGALPYRKRDYLLTRAERSFFEVLIRAVPRDFHVFAKVRLADLVWIPRREPHRRRHMYRVFPKHIDFVLCDRGKVAPLLAIELDDSSHQWPNRIARDVFVNEALRAAGLPLVRVPVRRSYSPKEIEEMISAALLSPAVKAAEERAARTAESTPPPSSIVIEDVSRHINPVRGGGRF